MMTTEEKTTGQVATQVAAPTKTKVEKAQTYMGLISTSLGVLGAIGTAFVWLTTTFFTGDVTIKPDKAVPSLMVKVIDKKGQQSTCYNQTISLMPGDYHLEFGVPDKQPISHADVHVELFKTLEIPYAVPEQLTDEPQPEQPKKKWWQFWKRNK